VQIESGAVERSGQDLTPRARQEECREDDPIAGAEVAPIVHTINLQSAPWYRIHYGGRSRPDRFSRGDRQAVPKFQKASQTIHDAIASAEDLSRTPFENRLQHFY
jgi:hypothetical protein